MRRTIALCALSTAAGFVQQLAPMSRSRPSARAAASIAAPEAEAVEMAECPETVWGARFDARAEQAALRARELKAFPLEIDAASLGLDGEEAQRAYFARERETMAKALVDHGVIVLRGFSLAREPEGFQQLTSALGLEPCLDPLHSVSARPTIGDGKSAVYEAVNKESRKNFFIGMHNEFVGKRAPRRAAFVCFKAAEEGGEFLVCDGRRVFRDLPTELLGKLYDNSIRYSVMELPFFGWIDSLPEMLQEPMQGIVKATVSAALNAKVDFDVELQWGSEGYDGVRMLQARAPVQPPAVRHPESGEPTWFCNVHSHSAKLRRDREEIYGKERFESGASRINKSDMFFGDGSGITDEELAALDEATVKNIEYIKMTPGDVVLVDNYSAMHGRNVFDGTRKHAVTWFK